MKQKPQILKQTIVASSKLFKIEQLHLKFSNGVERVFERMKSGRRKAVVIIPMLDSDTILLIREYCAGTDRYELFFPKGLVDEGETMEEAALRELKEEVSFGAKKLDYLHSMVSAPGYWGGKADIYVASELYPESLEGDEPEPLEVVEWKLSEYQSLLKHREFTEARSIASLMLLREKLNGI